MIQYIYRQSYTHLNFSREGDITTGGWGHYLFLDILVVEVKHLLANVFQLENVSQLEIGSQVNHLGKVSRLRNVTTRNGLPRIGMVSQLGKVSQLRYLYYPGKDS